MVFRTSRSFRALVSLTPAVFLAACGSDYPQTTFEPITYFGRLQNSLFSNTFWWTIGILVLVEVLIVFFAYRYRERPGQPKPKQIHGNVKLEFLWTVIPAVIVLFLAIPTIRGIFEMQAPPSEDALVVEVIGHQWWWEFRYPQYGVSTANEVVLPRGREIDFQMYSADVIHSFWIPRLGGKRDVNPQPRPREGEGRRINHLVYTPQEEGYFLGQCAEFCGASHAIMRMAAVVVDPAEFEAWTARMGGTPQPAVPQDTQSVRDTIGASQRPAAAPPAAAVAQATPEPAPGSLEAQGKQLFTSRPCAACHTIKGVTGGVLGPNLTNFGARHYVGAGAKPNTQEWVEAWIRDPQSLKPGALMPGAHRAGGGMGPTNLSDEEVRAIATYLRSLK